MSGNDVVQVGDRLAGRDRAAARTQGALELISLPEVGDEGRSSAGAGRTRSTACSSRWIVGGTDRCRGAF
jgi:hypothetical protein